jgi:hypothetical protein
MLSTLATVGEYIGLGFIVILAILGLYFQARNWFKKSKSDEEGSKYADFMSTITALRDKISVMQSEMQDLQAKVQHLEENNEQLLMDVGKYNEKANHYLALFMTRCPYEELKSGKGYCDYFHPLDKKRIREEIVSKIALESDSIEDMVYSDDCKENK